jgi:hypothetical protein
MEKREKRKENPVDKEIREDRQLFAQFRVVELISELNMSAKQFPLILMNQFFLLVTIPMIVLVSFCLLLLQ